MPQYTPLKLPLGRWGEESGPEERAHYQWTSVDPDQNRYRYYAVTVEEDIWGDPCLILSWGRFNSHPRKKFIWPKDEGELERLIDKAFELREKHRYRLVG